MRAGRLKIGPWYVLADEFLAGGESLVRNLLIGRLSAKPFGSVMTVGYTPDSFGHVSQIPQILNGFGIRSFIFARGLDWKRARMGQVFRWNSPDGASWVYACWLPLSYGQTPLTVQERQGRRSPLPWEQVRDKLTEYLTALRKHKHCGVLLICNGNDHARVEPELGQHLARANRQLKEYHFEHAGFDRYAALVEARAARLEGTTGELRDGGPMGVLTGTQSSRMYLKQANQDCKDTLTLLAEPAACLAALGGLPYPHAELNHAWKKLLKNHPHDDICGCSVDGVHRDMETRFRNCLELCNQITRRSLHWISCTAAPPATDGPRVVAAHGLAGRKRYRFRHTFELPDSTPRTVILNAAGKPQPTIAEKIHHQPPLDWDVKTGTFRDRPRELQTMEWLGELPPCGYEQFTPGFGAQPKTKLSARGRTIENGLVRVTMRANGSVRITDKKTRRTVVGNVFEDNEDAGDGYDYSRLAKSPRTIRAAVAGRVKARLAGGLAAEVTCKLTMPVPASLSPDRKSRSRRTVALPIETTVRLLDGERRVEFHTVIQNTARDHRLRVAFESGVSRARVASAEGAFDVIDRPIDLPPARQVANWGQKPIPTKHQDAFVSVSGGGKGLTLINRGLPEYEARRDRGQVSLVLTLFRSFGHLSVHDHFERGSAAGPEIPTPDAQCLRLLNVDYAVVVHKGTWQSAGTWQDAHAFNSPAELMEAFGAPADGVLPASGSMVEVSDPAAVISAVKASESGGGILVRLWNIRTRPIRPTLKTMFEIASAALTNLAEDALQPLKHQGHQVQLPQLQPKQIATVLLWPVKHRSPAKLSQMLWPTCATGMKTY